jgi:hypothetical protein
MTTIANAMYGTDPARAYYPLFLTNQEIIASFYLNVLGRPADAEGLAYWTAQLNATGATPGSVITTMVNVVANYVALGGTDPAGLTSAALFNNKVAVAQYYGEHSGNIADATVVLAGVTADPATVTAVEAQITSGAIGQSGITAALTTGSDLVNGTAAGDTVTGVFGTAANATYNAGDVIDLGAGSTDTLNLVANGVTPSDAVIVKNVEVINITDTQGATFDDTLVQNNPGINFLSTQTGKTSTVTSAALGSVYGLAGAGNLTVTYTGTSGTSDNAMISLAGVGASTAKSAINVSSSNSIEKVSLATTGTNYVTLVGGTNAATVAVTGNGTNTLDLSGVGAMAAVGTIDASASTGTNTIALGSNFSSGVTVKGGTGTDTVSATLASATLIAPTFTGVEKFSTTWTAYGVLDLGSTTGLTSVSISDKAAATGTMSVQNAASTVSTLTVSNIDSTAANSALKFGYATASHGDLTFNVGSTSSTATAVDLGAVTLSNTNSVQVTTLGALDHNMDSLTIKGTQTSVGFTIAAGGALEAPTTATGSVGALTFNLGAGSSFSGNFNVATPGKHVGDVTVNVNGDDTNFQSYVYTSGNAGVAGGGGVGNVNVNITGSSNNTALGIDASGGAVGNVTFAVNGDSNTFHYNVSAGYWPSAGGLHTGATLGQVGDIAVTVAGTDNFLSGSIGAEFGGNVGNINVNVAGDGNDVYLSAYAEHQYFYDGTGYDDGGGGNVGNVTINVDGNSFADVSVLASGGHIGDISVSTSNGGDVSLYANSTFSYWYSAGPADGGNIGNVTVSVGADSNASVYVSADGGDVGNISVTATGDNASGYVAINALFVSGSDDGSLSSSDYNRGGNIGDITIEINGKDANAQVWALASGGSIGNVSVSVTGANASGTAYLESHTVGNGSPGGNIGTVSVAIGDNAGFEVGANFDATMGAMTVTGGSHAWFDLYVSGGNAAGTQFDDLASFTGANLTFQDHASIYVEFNGFSGAVGSITANNGDYASDTYNFKHVTGSVGSLSLTEGAHATTAVNYGSSSHNGIDTHSTADAGTAGAVSWTAGAGSHFTYGVSGGAGSIGKVTIAGGDSASTATVNVKNESYTVGTAGGVDASAFAGDVTVNLQEVGYGNANAVGTVIKVGTGGSDVTGTQGSDNIFLGSGHDLLHFDQDIDANTKTDIVFTFTAGAGGDTMDVYNAGTLTVDTALTANPGASTAIAADHITRLVDITGGQDISTASGLVTALAGGGEYANVDIGSGAHVTIVTALSSSATTLYVFDVNDTSADGVVDAGEVTLVGIVNTTGGTLATLTAANFS